MIIAFINKGHFHILKILDKEKMENFIYDNK